VALGAIISAVAAKTVIMNIDWSFGVTTERKYYHSRFVFPVIF
jgi:hypothetical protein